MGRKLQDKPMKMELIEGSETSAYTNQTPGNYPKENLLYSEHSESLKSRIRHLYGEETARQAYEDGTDRGFRNVGIYKPDAGELP
jgi:hypothetical protein